MYPSKIHLQPPTSTSNTIPKPLTMKHIHVCLCIHHKMYLLAISAQIYMHTYVMHTHTHAHTNIYIQCYYIPKNLKTHLKAIWWRPESRTQVEILLNPPPSGAPGCNTNPAPTTLCTATEAPPHKMDHIL